MKNSEMPAMPQPIASHIDEIVDTREYCPENAGLTKREHFAGLMMQAEKIHHGAKGGYSYSEKAAAEGAVLAADALLAELEKDNQA